MALSGTVIRVTTRGRPNHRRKQHLIVVLGSVDYSRREDERGDSYGRIKWKRRVMRELWEARRRGRIYRIRDYPSNTRPGDTVSFEDLGVRKGGYWEAKIPGYATAKPVSKLSPLEQEVRNYPNLAKERASNVISGLGMLIDYIKKKWNHSTIGVDRYKRPIESPNPFDAYVKDYVEVEAPTWSDNETAVRDYKSILYALRGESVETRRRVGGGYSGWGYQPGRWEERTPDELLDFLREETRHALSMSIRASNFKKFERWVERQREKFGYI